MPTGIGFWIGRLTWMGSVSNSAFRHRRNDTEACNSMSAPAESRDDVFSERVRSQTGGTIVSVAAAAVIDWTGLSTNPLVHAMAVRTKGMERPVDARRLRQRDALVTVEAVLTAGAVDEVVVTPERMKAKPDRTTCVHVARNSRSQLHSGECASAIWSLRWPRK